MTAVEPRSRLEARGLWRESAGAQPREVGVSLGLSTLVLTGDRGQPLGHWALAGTHAVAEEDGATRYSILAGDGETLEIRDPRMIAAIAAAALDFGAPRTAPPTHPRRLSISGLILAALIAAFALKGPEVIEAQAARMVPPAQAREFGDRMLLAILEKQGPLCVGPAGGRALTAFGDRVAPGATLRVLILGYGRLVAALPGPTVLIDRTALSRARAPAELAGWIAQALGPDPGTSQVEAMMREAGPLASLGYIFRGTLSEAALGRAAEASLSPPATPDAYPAPPAAASLASAEWQALRSICG